MENKTKKINNKTTNINITKKQNNQKQIKNFFGNLYNLPIIPVDFDNNYSVCEFYDELIENYYHHNDIIKEFLYNEYFANKKYSNKRLTFGIVCNKQSKIQFINIKIHNNDKQLRNKFIKIIYKFAINKLGKKLYIQLESNNSFSVVFKSLSDNFKSEIFVNSNQIFAKLNAENEYFIYPININNSGWKIANKNIDEIFFTELSEKETNELIDFLRNLFGNIDNKTNNNQKIENNNSIEKNKIDIIEDKTIGNNNENIEIKNNINNDVNHIERYTKFDNTNKNNLYEYKENFVKPIISYFLAYSYNEYNQQYGIHKVLTFNNLSYTFYNLFDKEIDENEIKLIITKLLNVNKIKYENVNNVLYNGIKIIDLDKIFKAFEKDKLAKKIYKLLIDKNNGGLNE